MISIIAAVSENRAIGNKNKLLYWLPNDLKRFKALTTGHWEASRAAYSNYR